MLYLLCSIACSIGVSAVFKANEVREGDRGALLTANYAVATACAWAVLAVGAAIGDPGTGGTSADAHPTGIPTGGLEAISSYGPGMIALTVLTGTLFIATYFVLAWATRVAGMGLATGVMRVSVVLPVLASWAIWQEVPTWGQGRALVVAGAAFFCISYRSGRAGQGSGRSEESSPRAAGSSIRSASAAAFGVLLLLFLAGGTVDTCIKAFDELYARRYADTLFLIGVYGVSTVLGIAWVAVRRIRRGRWPLANAFAWGILLGLLNYAATLFFLKAVRQLEGPFVFPANSVSIVLGAALVGVYFWDERMSRINRIGLGLAVGALVLLRV